MRNEETRPNEPDAEMEAAVAAPSAIRNPQSAIRGRLLGLDVGTLRVGLAVCDRDRVVASPHSLLVRRTPEQDAAHFARLVRDEQIVGLVVGLPLNMDGSEGPQAVACRTYGDWLAGVLRLPVAYQDERLSTHAALDLMKGAKLTREQRKERRDKLAATLILQAYLDSPQPDRP